MNSHDKTLLGLACHARSKCSECPYEDMPECSSKLAADAVEMYVQMQREAFLKPLTYDEAICDDAFLEIKGDEYIDAALNLFACQTCDGSTVDGFIFYKTHEVDELKLMEIDYGKTWRCWSRRPTDAERDAAKWEEK